MKVILTGCAGFLGSNLVFKLLEQGHEVYGVDNLLFGYKENLDGFDNWRVTGFENLTKRELDSYDVLIHAATCNIIYAQEYALHTFETNAVNTIDLFKRFEGKIINISTSSVYGDAKEIPTAESAPTMLTNSYAMSKYIAEQYLELRGNFTTLRLSNTYGENQHPDHFYSGVIGKWIGQALNGQPIEIIGTGEQSRDFIYVGDVCDAICRAVEIDATNLPINISFGSESQMIYVKWLLEKQFSLTDRFIPKRTIDNINRRCLNIERANYYLNWHPKTDLKTGIEKTVNWMKKALKVKV